MGCRWRRLALQRARGPALAGPRERRRTHRGAARWPRAERACGALRPARAARGARRQVGPPRHNRGIAPVAAGRGRARAAGPLPSADGAAARRALPADLAPGSGRRRARLRRGGDGAGSLARRAVRRLRDPGGRRDRARGCVRADACRAPRVRLGALPGLLPRRRPQDTARLGRLRRLIGHRRGLRRQRRRRRGRRQRGRGGRLARPPFGALLALPHRPARRADPAAVHRDRGGPRRAGDRAGRRACRPATRAGAPCDGRPADARAGHLRLGRDLLHPGARPRRAGLPHAAALARFRPAV